MLQSSFIHIPGLDKEKEKMLWLNNIMSWEEYLRKDFEGIKLRKEESIKEHIISSIKAYQDNDHNYFLKQLPSNQHWRIYNENKINCCFLDIETTGLSRSKHEITMVGIYNGQESKVFINGINMDELHDEIDKYDAFITFNGKCFDMPFMKEKFPDMNLDKFHIDLRYVMRELGYSGGLKKIEKEIGICREAEIGDITGFEAVRLWHKYKAGDQASLDKLVKYNIADVENLKIMMDFAFNNLKKIYIN